jgi:hypothetical protein
MKLADVGISKPTLPSRRFDALKQSLSTALCGTSKRSHDYDQVKPKMARLISARLTKETPSPERTKWIG